VAVVIGGEGVIKCGGGGEGPQGGGKVKSTRGRGSNENVKAVRNRGAVRTAGMVNDRGYRRKASNKRGEPDGLKV